jgi:hypothetical protein
MAWSGNYTGRRCEYRGSDRMRFPERASTDRFTRSINASGLKLICDQAVTVGLRAHVILRAPDFKFALVRREWSKMKQTEVSD